MSDLLTPIPAPRHFAAMGTSGLKNTSGLIWEEYDPELRGSRAIEAFTRMSMSDPTCGAILWAIESVLRGVQWDVKPAMPLNAPYDAKPDTVAQEGADFLRQVLFDEMDNPWEQIISEALSCLTYGFSLAEKVYRRRSDGMVGLVDLSPRPQDTIARWAFDDDGKLVGCVQRNPKDGRELPIPMQKLLHFKVRNNKRSPEGVSILRTAYKSWVYATNMANVEAIGLERDLAGLPVARIPQEVMRRAAENDVESTAIVAEFVTMVRDLRMNQQAGVVIASDPFPTPDGSAYGNIRQYDIELLSSTSNRAGQSDPIIRRHRGDIATSVLADFLLLGQGRSSGGGSFALSADKTDLFQQSLISIRDCLAAEFQRKLIAPLWVLNGFPADTRPVLAPGPIADIDVASLAEYISKLAGAGARMFPDTDLENSLRRKAGLPPLTEETIEAAEKAEQDALDARAQAAAQAKGIPASGPAAPKPPGASVTPLRPKPKAA